MPFGVALLCEEFAMKSDEKRTDQKYLTHHQHIVGGDNIFPIFFSYPEKGVCFFFCAEDFWNDVGRGECF